VIIVDHTRCKGCGECVSVCPAGAITLLDERAFIDEALCEGCEICLTTCPQNALLSVETAESGLGGETLPDPEPIPSEVTPAQLAHASPSPGGEVLPAFSSILVSTGREVIPRLASMAIDLLDQRIQDAYHAKQVKRTQFHQRNGKRQKGRQRQRRRRRQGNW
jgi:Fe-S-cluster-containing hydrogenase component 2